MPLNSNSLILGNKKADITRQDELSASQKLNPKGTNLMNNQIVPQTVIFNNQEILTFEQNGTHYTAMKPICENIGLDWASQFKRIQRDEVLNSVIVMMTTTGNDGKKYEMLSLPIQMLNGWLFGIDVSRVKESAKELLIKYKKECYQALYNYWHNGEAKNPRFEKISDKQAYQLKTAVEKRCKNNGDHYQTVWTALKHRFEVPKYTDILVKDFDNALNLVWTIALPVAVIEPSQPIPTTDHSDYNALWRTIGLLETHRVDREMRKFQTNLQELVRQFNVLYKTRGLIYDALAQQRITTDTDHTEQAEAFIARQLAMKIC